jgi:hypothetical protein
MENTNQRIAEKAKIIPIPPDEFRLGLTMAGAISAGCYTGGAMDYLFELLEIWQQAKDGTSDDFKSKEHLIPRHKVIIEAMGGASAGGMTTTIAALYALNGQIKPVREPGAAAQKKDNLFYDSWVLMDDDLQGNAPKPTFEKLWDTGDLDANVFGSFLNSGFVDRIADGVFNSGSRNIARQVENLPKYVSGDLQMILSHTLLRGVPLEVDFLTPIAKTGRNSILPNHTSYEHYVVSHYHLNKGVAPKTEEYLFLNPYDPAYSDTMKLATIATGAFPVGLLYRAFDPKNFSADYLKTIFKRIISGKFGEVDPDPGKLITLKSFPPDFSSFTVDGGAINNEPYREVMSLLSDRYGIPEADSFPSYGVIMIDPFPDQAKLKKDYQPPVDLLDVIPEVIGALTDQSRVKRREMLEADSGQFFRSIIFPRKWNVTGKGVRPDPHPLACASVGAFGGFFDISFRQHDYFLGRNNARNFFRFFFSMPYDPENGIIHPIHRDWTQDMIDAFVIEKDGKKFLPIIPDLNILTEGLEASRANRFKLTVTEKPVYDPAPLFEAGSAIQKRLLRIMEILKKRDYTTKKEAEGKITQTLMDQHYHKTRLSGILSGFTSGALGLVYWLGRKAAARALTEKIIKTVLADLEKSGLLTKSSLPPEKKSKA